MKYISKLKKVGGTFRPKKEVTRFVEITDTGVGAYPFEIKFSDSTPTLHAKNLKNAERFAKNNFDSTWTLERID